MQLFKRVLLPFLWGKGTFSVPSKEGEIEGVGNFSHTDLTDLTDLSIQHLYKNIKNTVYIFRTYGLLKIHIKP